MVEPKNLQEQMQGLSVDGPDAELLGQMTKLMNDPKYLESVEQEVE